ncbi:MAG: AAA-like domain-containing protein, partial [Rhodothermales bacterium]
MKPPVQIPSPDAFYVVGGTMKPDVASYVEREADDELFERARAGDFCYVLTPRQMGKSSLMVRTAGRLDAQGVRTATIDLSGIGGQDEQMTAEQWYYGIAHTLCLELSLDVDLKAWWSGVDGLPVLQRFSEFLRDVVLVHTTERVVIFVDEIDTTLSLPFTDDFFAAIRACYNARASNSEYERLTFVLLGVASPSDLIKDAARTPFNVGHRIDLTDFTFDEARPLAQGLAAEAQQGEAVLQRILYWTAGHPYLTQKLCLLVAEEEEAASVDGLVEAHFLKPEQRRQEPNLAFVRDRLIHADGDPRKLLRLYRRVRRGKGVEEDPLSLVQTALKLSGLVIPRTDGTLAVRNRIYEQVFTTAWVQQVMPADWNRRVAVASLVLVLLGLGYGYFLPKPLIQTIQTAVDDVPRSQYETLRSRPGFAGKAD